MLKYDDGDGEGVCRSQAVYKDRPHTAHGKKTTKTACREGGGTRHSEIERKHGLYKRLPAPRNDGKIHKTKRWFPR